MKRRPAVYGLIGLLLAVLCSLLFAACRTSETSVPEATQVTPEPTVVSTAVPAVEPTVIPPVVPRVETTVASTAVPTVEPTTIPIAVANEVCTAADVYHYLEVTTVTYDFGRRVWTYRHSDGEFHADFVDYATDHSTVLAKGELIAKDGTVYARGYTSPPGEEGEYLPWGIIQTDVPTLPPLSCKILGGAQEIVTTGAAIMPDERHFIFPTETSELPWGEIETTKREIWVGSGGLPVLEKEIVYRTESGIAAASETQPDPTPWARIETTYSPSVLPWTITAPTMPTAVPTLVSTAEPTVIPTVEPTAGVSTE